METIKKERVRLKAGRLNKKEKNIQDFLIYLS